MNDKPMLPRGVLTGETAKARASGRFPIDWQAVARAAGVGVPLSEVDRANVESVALRYRLELDHERKGDGISFGKMRGHAGKIASAAEKLRGLLADPAAPSLLCADLDALKDLQNEAANIANSDTGGSGSPAYSFDLRESLLRVIAGRWRDAGGEIQAADFYRASAEVLRQVIPYAVEGTSQEQAVRRFVREFKGTEVTS